MKNFFVIFIFAVIFIVLISGIPEAFVIRNIDFSQSSSDNFDYIQSNEKIYGMYKSAANAFYEENYNEAAKWYSSVIDELSFSEKPVPESVYAFIFPYYLNSLFLSEKFKEAISDGLLFCSLINDKSGKASIYFIIAESYFEINDRDNSLFYFKCVECLCGRIYLINRWNSKYHSFLDQNGIMNKVLQ
ncbi:MAG: hypothetical protein JW982_15810 [Spirochaetes bacterium]|nr:hypothetical protein [Spirochaetota bacterium]